MHSKYTVNGGQDLPENDKHVVEAYKLAALVHRRRLREVQRDRVGGSPDAEPDHGSSNKQNVIVGRQSHYGGAGDEAKGGGEEDRAAALALGKVACEERADDGAGGCDADDHFLLLDVETEAPDSRRV